jgi:hypothetical protein
MTNKNLIENEEKNAWNLYDSQYKMWENGILKQAENYLDSPTIDSTVKKEIEEEYQNLLKTDAETKKWNKEYFIFLKLIPEKSPNKKNLNKLFEQIEEENAWNLYDSQYKMWENGILEQTKNYLDSPTIDSTVKKEIDEMPKHLKSHTTGSLEETIDPTARKEIEKMQKFLTSEKKNQIKKAYEENEFENWKNNLANQINNEQIKNQTEFSENIIYEKPSKINNMIEQKQYEGNYSNKIIHIPELKNKIVKRLGKIPIDQLSLIPEEKKDEVIEALHKYKTNILA